MLHQRRKPLTEFAVEFKNLFPELWDQFLGQYEDPEFIKLMGDDRVCTVCAAIVHSGARAHHLLWHKQLTMAIWSLQGAVLSEMVKSGSIVADEDDEEPAKKPKKGKKKKKGKNQ
jgi:hypothetical protein